VNPITDMLAELSGAAHKLAWQKLGACRGADDNDYYPDRGSRARVRQAKATCAVCPVAAVCLDWAMETNEQHGVWGGLTRRERAELRRQRADAARAPQTQVAAPLAPVAAQIAALAST
jgi:WhiB family redox-sensing transcriptional regulator